MSKNLKKIAKSLAVMILLLNLALTVYSTQSYRVQSDNPSLSSSMKASLIPSAFAVSTPFTELQKVGGSTGLNPFNIIKHKDAPTTGSTGTLEGVSTLGSTAYFTLDFVKLLMSTVAVIMIVYMAIRLVVSGSNEESVKKTQKGLAISILGLIIIQLADVIVKKVFFGEYGNILEDKTTAQEFATEGTAQIRGIVGFVQLALGAVAVLIIIVNGIKMMIVGGEEEARKKSLKSIGISLAGLMVVLLSELIVKGFVYPDLENPGSALPSSETGKGIIIMITNFISGFVAVISFVVLLYAGYLYVAAGGEETTREKVKKLLTGAIIGILLAFGAYAIANTLITFKEPTEYSATDTSTEVKTETTPVTDSTSPSNCDPDNPGYGCP